MKTNLLITLLTILSFAEQTSAQLTFQKTIGGTALSLGDKGMLIAGGAGTLQLFSPGAQTAAPAAKKE